MTRFSIIMCTYNPEKTIFRRSFAACLALASRAVETELVVVDNNSSVPVTLPSKSAGVKLIREPKQGLVHARIAGLRASSGAWVIFMDDDNEPEPDYVVELEKLLVKHPEVGIWGPGTITVELPRECPSWIEKNFRHLYQEKKHAGIMFGNEKGWPYYYPAGSGMAVDRTVLENHLQLFEAGILSATGRQGKTLSSGEDAQVVWTAIKMDRFAGTAPGLQLKHIISAERCSLHYLIRLQENLAFSYCKSLSEIFPEKKSELRPLSIAGHLKLVLTALWKSSFFPLRFLRRYKIESAWFTGVKSWWANK